MIPKVIGRLGLAPRKKITDRDLIKAESKIGATLFGPIPRGHRRDFFCLDSKTWVWHEEWTDNTGKHQTMTTRYEVRPNGVMKIQDGQRFTYVNGQELVNLAGACRMYYQQVAKRVYNRNVVV